MPRNAHTTLQTMATMFEDFNTRAAVLAQTPYLSHETLSQALDVMLLDLAYQCLMIVLKKEENTP